MKNIQFMYAKIQNQYITFIFHVYLYDIFFFYMCDIDFKAIQKLQLICFCLAFILYTIQHLNLKFVFVENGRIYYFRTSKTTMYQRVMCGPAAAPVDTMSR